MKGCVQTLVLNAASRKRNGFQFAFECGDGMWKGLSLFGKAAVAQSEGRVSNPGKENIFLFCNASGIHLLGTGNSLAGVKLQGRETGKSAPSV
jgi:hypothetical protein